VPHPARVPGIGHGCETFQQAPAAGRVQAGGMSGQLAQGGLRRGGHGHARLDGQRDLPAGKEIFSNPLS